MTTRRSFLSRATAALAGGAAASLAPVAPVLAAPAENPDLLALGEQMDSVLAAFHTAAARKAEARALAEKLCPPVPDEIVENDPVVSSSYTAQEVDVEGDVVFPPNVVRDGREYARPPRRIINSELAKRAVKQGNMYAPKRTKAGRAFWEKIAIAEHYEAARAAAIEAAGLREATEAHYWAALDVEKLAYKIRDAEPVTTRGVLIHAQALLAFAEVDGISSSYPGKAALMLGRRLAELMVKVGATGAA
jgi:hypothetical protein